MAQWAKALVIQPDNLCWISGTYIAEENWFPQAMFSDFDECFVACVHTQINKYK